MLKEEKSGGAHTSIVEVLSTATAANWKGKKVSHTHSHNVTKGHPDEDCCQNIHNRDKKDFFHIKATTTSLAYMYKVDHFIIDIPLTEGLPASSNNTCKQ